MTESFSFFVYQEIHHSRHKLNMYIDGGCIKLSSYEMKDYTKL